MIDISRKSIINGSSLASLSALKTLLSDKNSFKGKKTKIGIITYDEKINFYDVRKEALENVKISVVDPDDPCMPIPLNKWLFSPFLDSDLEAEKTEMNGNENGNNGSNVNNGIMKNSSSHFSMNSYGNTSNNSIRDKYSSSDSLDYNNSTNNN